MSGKIFIFTIIIYYLFFFKCVRKFPKVFLSPSYVTLINCDASLRYSERVWKCYLIYVGCMSFCSCLSVQRDLAYLNRNNYIRKYLSYDIPLFIFAAINLIIRYIRFVFCIQAYNLEKYSMKLKGFIRII